jgi:hypothetical protein
MKKYRYVLSGYQVTDKPRFEHFCKSCQFLGQHGKYDLYACINQGDVFGTVVARKSGDDPDYSSGIEFADNLENPLHEAFERALGMGFKPQYWPRSYKKEVYKKEGPHSMTFFLKYFVFQYCIEEPVMEPSKSLYDRMMFLGSDWFCDVVYKTNI